MTASSSIQHNESLKDRDIVVNPRVKGLIVIVALCVLSLAVGAIVPAETGLQLIAYFTAGMLSALAVTVSMSLLGGQREERKSTPVAVTFNLALVTQGIDRLTDKTPRVTVTTLPSASKPDEPSPRDFVGRDNALALAYLRLEIERVVSKIVEQEGLGDHPRRQSTMTMLQMLEQKGMLPGEVRGALIEVLRICNEAIHGGRVSDETALATVTAGMELIARLEQISKGVVEDSIQEYRHHEPHGAPNAGT